MSLPLLKEGICEKNWEKVIMAYQNMTGDIIDLEGVVLDQPNKLNKRNQKHKETPKTLAVKTTEVGRRDRSVSECSLKPIDILPTIQIPKKIKVEDEANKHDKMRPLKISEKINKKTKEVIEKRLAERRENIRPSMLIHTKCAKCGREDDVHPDLIPKKVGNEQPNYYCNGCVGR